MKKLALMLVLALLAALPALCEAPGEVPDLYGNTPIGDLTPRDGEPSGDSIALEVNGETVHLGFDSSPQYSSVQGGMVQASYYAYGADGVTLYELYVMFPATARAGMVFTPEYAAMTGEECSVVLYISDEHSEQYYFTDMMDGLVFPEGSGFSITIDSIQDLDGGTAYEGSLSATLISMDMSSGQVQSTLTIPQTAFSFTIGGSRVLHDDPLATPIPDDMRKV